LTLHAITIADVVRDRARHSPDALALLAPGRTSLSYASLARAIDDTIAGLHRAGFARGDRLALSLPEGPEMAVAVLAVSGCATCVPLNPALDEASYRVALERLRVDAMIAPDIDTPAVRAAGALAIPCLRAQWRECDPAGTFTLATATPRAARSPDPPLIDDVALVLHTSGTTQRPKAVPLTHRMLVGPALDRARQYQLTATDRCLIVRPLFTAGGLRRCLFPALVVGGSVVSTPGAGGHSLVDWLATFEPTFYSGAPAIHRALLDEMRERESVPRFALRFVLSASAALPLALAEQLQRTLGVPVLQGYGMTEAGVVAQNPLPPGRSRTGSVGLPAGNEFAVLGEGGRRLASGEIGEIVVRGPEVFAGYEGDSADNRDTFVEGWFRTGDLGHVDDDGFLFIDGRVKELINRGGFKVSPSAVDAALRGHPDIVDAVTFGVPHATLGEDVVAAVVVRDSSDLGARAVRDFAFANLASFMVPSQVIVVEELPRFPSGKVQRADVAALLRPRLKPVFTPPRDAREALVARAFADVLGSGAIGAFDNFFELGGDSLRGAQLVGRINAEAGASLEVASLFRCPTVAEFAEELGIARRVADAVPPPIRPGPRRDYRPDNADAS
jgi:acyl-CoA synthetase (AMP-forming)/AMP-acid ligase II